MSPDGKVSTTVMPPLVASVPELDGVNVKLAFTATVKVIDGEVFANRKSGDCTTVTAGGDVLLPAPTRVGSSGSLMPIGTMAVALLDSVPVCGAMPVMVMVTVAPAGRVVIVLMTLLLITFTVPHTAPPVGRPHDAPTPVIATGTVSLKTVKSAASGPALVTVEV